jgi:hypothetical protein
MKERVGATVRIALPAGPRERAWSAFPEPDR